MGFKFIELKMPTDYSEQELQNILQKNIGSDEFTYSIDLKSLDARNKGNIHWKIRAGVLGNSIEEDETPDINKIDIPYAKRDKTVCVIGSGPAGFFCAYTLATAGFKVKLIEKGKEVNARAKDIHNFETGGKFLANSNYAVGEGGAGTFSDGKLTSRTKSISAEKRFVFEKYVSAGAPEEIQYLSHPHIGSNNLIKVAVNLREEFLKMGEILFETECTGVKISRTKAAAIETNHGKIEADYIVFAPGHSSYPTYEMLIRAGVKFKVKPFAVGFRVEHPQELINLSQWNKKSLEGVKAAEYRLSHRDDKNLPVFTFCMCPGGKVVPAAPDHGINIVNGMSYYARDSKWANSAIVAAINFNEEYGRELEPLEAIEKLKSIENKFYEFAKGYSAPACTIKDFLNRKTSANLPESSYPLGLKSCDLRSLMPNSICKSISAALKVWDRKIKGFSDGLLLGLESKTSSTLQAERNDNAGSCRGFDNLYITGEGSGLAGGIVSSAADGIKTALNIIAKVS